MDFDGNEASFCSQNAIYMTRNGLKTTEEIKSHSYDYEDPNSWGSCFSGLKLMEHSWLANDFVNGVIEHIWDNPCVVAWVGDYADYESDFENGYTLEIYRAVWCEDGLPEKPFAEVPDIHSKGFLVNHTKGIFIDLEKYKDASSFNPAWDKTHEWCIHPLPILTAIGNGRGGGDYEGTNMGKVGSWAMDVISFTESRPEGVEEIQHYHSISFVEGEMTRKMKELRDMQRDFEDYMTTNRWDTCCIEGIYADDGIRAVSMFMEFIETGRVTDDDGRELVQ